MAYNLFSKQLELDNQSSFVVCDAVPDAAKAFITNFRTHFPGAQVCIASTPEEAVMKSSMVITMLPSSPHVQSVYADAGGILSALKTLRPEDVKETLCIDSTTLDVKAARQVAADIIDAGAQMVDAPVSGGLFPHPCTFC